MPERDRFPREYFTSNPFEDMDAFDMFRELRWGDEWTEAFEINAPEDMAVLGHAAELRLEYHLNPHQRRKNVQGRRDGRRYKWKKNEAPFLAVGKDTNRLYLVPMDADGMPVDIPSKGYVVRGKVSRTEYWSTKGNDDALYYHDHEPPFPALWWHPTAGVYKIVPYHQGPKRSYAVASEGIVG